ncbi:Ku protein [Streptomyces sp. NPDC059496]|uniref:non-homologous end joining protein Ku n=1 Tax=Streptomyces sp. NPDC059496 TaxID=3346851 RepID=UPI003681DBB7
MRPIWSGAISFGLVTVMCKVWPATESHDVVFRQIHLADGGRVRVRKMCELDGQEVSAAEIGRGYETATAVIPITDQDLDAMPVATARTIELAGFLPAASIDPVQIGTAYYLSPDGPAAQKPYVLLRKALERSSRVAVARYSMRNRERLGLLRVVGDVIAMHQLRWPDEIRPADVIPAPAVVDVTDEEIDAAVELAAALASGGFELAEQRDAYRDAVEEVIAAKEAGHRIEPAAEPLTAGKVVDLMAALQQSVHDAKAARGENTTPANVHGLPTGRRTAKKATKRVPAKSVPGATKKAAAKRKPRSA